MSVLDVTSGKTVWLWLNPDPDSAWVNAIAFSPNGNLVAVETDTGLVVVARAEAWQVLNSFRQRGEIRMLAFSPDSIYLASGGDDSDVKFWTYQKTPWVETLGPHGGPVRMMAFAPFAAASSRQQLPARILATISDDGVARIWTQTDAIPLRQDVPDGRVVAFAPDGQLLAVGGRESGCTSSGSCPEVLRVGTAAVYLRTVRHHQ